MFPPVPLPELVLYGLAGLLGLAACFFGYRLFRIWLALAGLQTGFYLGLWLGGLFLANDVLIIVLAVIAAVLMAGLFGLIFRAGAFLAGAGVLVLLAALVMQLLPFGTNLYVLLGAVLVGGILGVLLVRPFLILATAVNGAFLVADSVANLLIGTPISQYVQLHQQLGSVRLILLLIGMVVLIILGAMVQFWMSRQSRQKAAVKKPGPLLATSPAISPANPAPAAPATGPVSPPPGTAADQKPPL
jgi:hypothetical protein